MAVTRPTGRGMDNDIKPTKLHGVTGTKHFKYLTEMSQSCRPRFEGRPRPEHLLFKAVILAAGVAVLAAYGQLKIQQPGPARPTSEKEKDICDPGYKQVPLCSCEMTQAERDLIDCNRKLKKCKAAMFMKSMDTREKRRKRAAVEQPIDCKICSPLKRERKDC